MDPRTGDLLPGASATLPDGSPAIVEFIREFKNNLNVFSESSLVDLDWSNVVVAGSAVVTSLLAVPKEHASSKRALRRYFHEQLAPASDVDLFVSLPHYLSLKWADRL